MAVARRRSRLTRVRLVLAAALAALMGALLASSQHGNPASAPHAAAATRSSTAEPPAPSLDATGGMRLLHEHLVFTDGPPPRTPPPAIAADSGILVDLDSGTVIWSRAPHVAHAPASTTKVMTSLVALENLSPARTVTITPDALTQQPDETVMGLRAGEQLSVEDLMSGMLLVSGNDAATALAVDTVGMARFVAAMNAQEQALGLRDSHFVTPVGLDDPGQYASAYDLAVIAAVDMRTFPVFADLVRQRQVNIPQTPTHQAYPLVNLNRLLRLYPPAVGIKPGWTGNAGPCLVAMAVRGGHRLLAVLMNAPRLYTDMRALLDWGFTQEGLPPLLPPTPHPPTPSPHPATPAPSRRP